MITRVRVSLVGVLVSLLVLFALLFGAGAALAQPPQQNEFVPIDTLPPSDQLPSAPLLVAAYVFVWLAAMFYLWTIWRRLGKVETEIQALERRKGAGAHR